MTALANKRPTISPLLLSIGVVFLLLCVPARPSSRKPSENLTPVGQEEGQRSADVTPVAGHLSEPSRVANISGPVWMDGRSPTWAYGYVARLTLGDFPAGLEIYGRDGKLVSEARVSIPGAMQAWLVAAIPTKSGGAIASGTFESEDETSDFVAETSVSGGVVSVIHTENYLAARMCQAGDGTVWTLGRDVSKESEHNGEYPLVRQYSFEKGLLHGYLARSLVNFQEEGSAGGGEGPGGTFLVCGKDRMVGFLNETNEYFEIDPAREKVARWKLPRVPAPEGRVTGLAVTESGRVYASLFEVPDATDVKTHGLFELQAEPGKAMARWALVEGTLNSQSRIEDAPKGSFFRLWGADGDELVIRRLFDADMSWVRVIP